MSTTHPARSAAETAEMLELIDTAITETRSAGRPDLAEKLIKCRRQLTTGAWHVLVAGEFKKGKSALVNGLLGVPVCGVDPVAFTAVPTLVKHGDKPAAVLVPEPAPGAAHDPAPIRIDIRKAAEYGRSGIADDGTRLRAVEATLKRELLADGLVLVAAVVNGLLADRPHYLRSTASLWFLAVFVLVPVFGALGSRAALAPLAITGVRLLVVALTCFRLLRDYPALDVLR
ncbi:MAG: dynamin family protein, partial [Kibdelosporangium sp.]